jgi:hypothetical protein
MRRSYRKTKILLFFMIALVLTSVIPPSLIANADTNMYDGYKLAEKTDSWAYYAAISSCIETSALKDGWNGDGITAEDASAGKWFGGGGAPIGNYIATDITSTHIDADPFCSSDEMIALINKAYVLWGFSSPLELLCDAGAQIGQSTDHNKPLNGAKCADGASGGNVYIGAADRSASDGRSQYLSIKNFQANIEGRVYGAQDPYDLFTGASEYFYLNKVLFAGCIKNNNILDTNELLAAKADANKNARLYGITSSSGINYYLGENSLTGIGATWQSSDKNPANTGDEGADTGTCKILSDTVNALFGNYQKYIEDNPDDDPIANTATTTSQTSCAIPGIGWIVCPVVRFLAKITDYSFNFLADSFLYVSPKVFDTSNTNSAYSAWQKMRDIANIAFVIAFLIIIFSQLTSVGITNYGVKKMLPRLVIAAILVNISYFVCQIAVDLSNVVGYSLQNLLTNLVPVSTSSTTGFWSGGGSWVSVAGGILAGIAGVGIAWVSLATLIPMLIAAVVALVMILFILVARQALVILLVVISPLAFVCYLLPNTDKLFKKWRSAFTAMLLLFPIIAMVYGVSTLASKILSLTFSSSSSALSGEMGQIVAAAVMVLPLFVVPGLLKKSLDGVGSIGNKLNALGTSGGKLLNSQYAGSKLDQAVKYKDKEAEKRRALIQSGAFKENYRKFDPRRLRNLASGAHGWINTNSGKFGEKTTASGLALAKKMEADEVDNAETMIRAQNDATVLPVEAQKIYKDAVERGDTVKARAAQNILLSSGAPAIKLLHDAVGDIKGNAKNQGTINSLRNDINGANLKGKDAALAAWGYKNYDPSTIDPDTLDRDDPNYEQKRADLEAKRADLEDAFKTLGYHGIGIGTLETEKDTFAGLNPVELAGQDIRALKLAAGITETQANGVLDNPNASQSLSEEKLAYFKSIAKRP